jgi:hypothetical protein
MSSGVQLESSLIFSFFEVSAQSFAIKPFGSDGYIKVAEPRLEVIFMIFLENFE